jgi:formylmethanofuran dehydrogenase subunit E
MCVCSDCLGEYAYCEECEEYYLNDNGHHLDKGFFCNNCFDIKYFPCDSCDEDTHDDDVEEIEGKYYCMSCAEDIRHEMDCTEYEQATTGENAA